MPWMNNYSAAELRRNTEKAMSLPVGLASPLWMAFGAAASAGVAWWWMSRLGRPFGFEARSAAIPPTAPAKPPPVKAPASKAPEAAPVHAKVPLEAPTPIETLEDDFTTLVGIGPRIAAALVERGVTRFSQLAAWTSDDLAAFDAELNLRGRGLRGDWIGQAKRVAEGA